MKIGQINIQAKYTSIIPLSFDLKACFTLADTTVKTLSHSEYKKLFSSNSEEEENAFGYLIIESFYTFEPFDTLITGPAKVRANILVIHGVLTFFTRNIFTVFQTVRTSTTIVTPTVTPSSEKVMFISEGEDFTQELNTALIMIVSASSERQKLIYTLFERWRKASYLFEESRDSLIHFDEGVLAYIHILEVLADEFKEILDLEISKKSDKLIAQLREWIDQNKPITNKSIKAVLNTYVENRVSLRSKIVQMLHELKLHSPKAEEIVKRYINFRNAIAHGRKDLYQSEATYPLLPFFSFIKDPYENFNVIRVLSARSIAKYLGIDLWKKEWTNILRAEMKPLPVVKEFIKDLKSSSATIMQSSQGKTKGVDPEVISYYYITGLLEYKELEISLRDLILNSKPDRAACKKLFSAAVTLADSQDVQLATKSQAIIRATDANCWSGYLDIRDVLGLYEYYKKDKVSWFKNWIAAGKL